MRIALDAMGGDHAPAEVVAGALKALEEDSEITVVLVGREAEVRAEIPTDHAAGDRIVVVNAEDVVGCDESPVDALRKDLEVGGVAHDLHTYEGQQHAFFNTHRPEVYNEEAAERAWSRSIAFLQKNLTA